jgi:hypothetical protein
MYSATLLRARNCACLESICYKSRSAFTLFKAAVGDFAMRSYRHDDDLTQPSQQPL